MAGGLTLKIALPHEPKLVLKTIQNEFLASAAYSYAPIQAPRQLEHLRGWLTNGG